MDISTFHERATSLSEAEALENISLAEDRLAKAEANLAKALEQQPALVKRLGELNKHITELNGLYVERSNSRLDEVIFGDPQVAEFANVDSKDRIEAEFVSAATKRLVTHHYPMAVRAVVAAQVAVAESKHAVLDSKAVLAVGRRIALAGPLVAHEKSITLGGGTTEALAREAAEAFLTARKLQEALSELDKKQAATRAQLSFGGQR